MVTSLNNINKVAEVYGESLKIKRTPKMEKISRVDEATFSSKGSLIQKAMQELNKLPDIREDRVAEVQNKLKTGSYNISAEEIVNKLSLGLDIKG
ncbi:MAG: flagellar biosynthesis anti-sigma factor FlgM [bacterium]